jgi:hypothetical protein
MSEMEMEHNQIDEVVVVVKFLDGTKKTFYEDDVGENFSDWLSDVNWEYKNEMESKHE